MKQHDQKKTTCSDVQTLKGSITTIIKNLKGKYDSQLCAYRETDGRIREKTVFYSGWYMELKAELIFLPEQNKPNNNPFEASVFYSNYASRQSEHKALSASTFQYLFE